MLLKLRTMEKDRTVNLINTLRQLSITEVDTKDTTSLSTMDLPQDKLELKVKELIAQRSHPTIRVSLSLEILQGNKSKSSSIREIAKPQLKRKKTLDPKASSLKCKIDLTRLPSLPLLLHVDINLVTLIRSIKTVIYLCLKGK